MFYEVQSGHSPDTGDEVAAWARSLSQAERIYRAFDRARAGMVTVGGGIFPREGTLPRGRYFRHEPVFVSRMSVEDFWAAWRVRMDRTQSRYYPEQ